MHSKEKEHQPAKSVVDNSLSLDSRRIAASASNDEVLLPFHVENEQHRDRLEINIVEITDQYQEVEIIYGNKKRRKRITKFLPKDFANIVYASDQPAKPSMRVGAMNLDNLSSGNAHLLLPEKFLRILTKISQVSEIKTAEKIWDSNERINTTEKAILVAVMNRSKPENERVDRMIVSLRCNEIPDQNSFKKFISEVLDLTKNSEKLAKVLFGNLVEKLSDEKKSSLNGCIKNIIAETDDSKRDHQMKFLQKIVNEISNTNQTSRSSF